MLKQLSLGAIALAFALQTQAAPSAGMWELTDVDWQQVWIGGDLTAPGNTFSAQNEDLQFSATLEALAPVVDPDPDWDFTGTYKDATLTLKNAGLWANACDTAADFTFTFPSVSVKVASTRYLADTNTANDGTLKFEITAANDWVTFVASYEGMPTVETATNGDKTVSGVLTAAALEIGVAVRMDIKGGSPVAPLNVRSRGVLPVVVYGSPNVHVADIDPATLRLACVEPLRWVYADVNGDGIRDLNLKFSTQAIVAKLPDVRNRARVTLYLTGALNDAAHTPIGGSDQVTVLKPGKAFRPPVQPPVSPGRPTK